MRSRYLALWVVAVVATGAAFVSYLALRFETVRLGYELDETTREYKRLSELRRLIALEAETLRERQRIHVIAERSLGMGSPEASHVVTIAPRTVRELNALRSEANTARERGWRTP